jgi:hypothetical protein
VGHADPKGSIIVGGPVAFSDGDRSKVLVVKRTGGDLPESRLAKLYATISVLGDFGIIGHRYEFGSTRDA